MVLLHFHNKAIRSAHKGFFKSFFHSWLYRIPSPLKSERNLYSLITRIRLCLGHMRTTHARQPTRHVNLWRESIKRILPHLHPQNSFITKLLFYCLIVYNSMCWKFLENNGQHAIYHNIFFVCFLRSEVAHKVSGNLHWFVKKTSSHEALWQCGPTGGIRFTHMDVIPIARSNLNYLRFSHFKAI